MPIKAFEAAARHQSLTAAANELSVTHASVSAGLFARWKNGSVPIYLFTRSARGVALTRAEGEASWATRWCSPSTRIAVALKIAVGKGSRVERPQDFGRARHCLALDWSRAARPLQGPVSGCRACHRAKHRTGRLRRRRSGFRHPLWAGYRAKMSGRPIKLAGFMELSRLRAELRLRRIRTWPAV